MLLICTVLKATWPTNHYHKFSHVINMYEYIPWVAEGGLTFGSVACELIYTHDLLDGTS